MGVLGNAMSLASEPWKPCVMPASRSEIHYDTNRDARLSALRSVHSTPRVSVLATRSSLLSDAKDSCYRDLRSTVEQVVFLASRVTEQ